MPVTESLQTLRANALFSRALCGARMQELARRERLVERQRIVDASSLFWALMGTLGGASAQYLSDVLRTLNCQQSWALRYKPFWNRLAKPAFARFMRAMFQQLCAELVTRVVKCRVKSAASYFSDILIDDGSSFGLADGLKHVFPGRYTKVRPAAVELHAHMSLFKDQVLSVKLSPDVEGERKFLPKPNDLPKRSLSIRDRGYLDLDYFQDLQGTEKFLISRWRCNLNPSVVKMRGVPRALARRYSGQPLKSVPRDHLKAARDIVVAFKRQGKDDLVLRLVVRELDKAKRRPTRRRRKRKARAERTSWIYLVTNLPSGFEADEILSLYRLRWQIELLFKDWKSYANLHLFQSENPAIVEGLIWASLCAALIKRAVAHCAQLIFERPMSTRAVAQAGPHVMRDLFSWSAGGAQPKDLARILIYLANTATRAHPRRDKLRPQEALGLQLASC